MVMGFLLLLWVPEQWSRRRSSWAAQEAFKVFPPFLSLVFQFSRCSWSRGESEMSLVFMRKGQAGGTELPKQEAPRGAHRVAVWSTDTPDEMAQCMHAESCPPLCHTMDCSLPGSSVQGILQARILEWVVMLSSRRYSQPKDSTHVSCIAGRSFTQWTTWEVLRRLHSGANLIFEPRRRISQVGLGAERGSDGSEAHVRLWRELRWWRDMFSTSANSLAVFVQKNRSLKPSMGRNGLQGLCLSPLNPYHTVGTWKILVKWRQI